MTIFSATDWDAEALHQVLKFLDTYLMPAAMFDFPLYIPGIGIRIYFRDGTEAEEVRSRIENRVADIIRQTGELLCSETFAEET